MNEKGRLVAHIVFLTLCWYASSMFLTFYNKWIVTQFEIPSSGEGPTAKPARKFPFPLLAAMTHMIFKCIFSALYQKVVNGELPFHVLDRRLLFTALAVGAFTGLDVGASNASYLLISVSFYTLVKPSTLLYVLFFSVCLGLQKFTCGLFCVVLLIVGGVVLVGMGEQHFEFLGFVLVSSACAFSGIRWALTQLMLQGMGESKKPTPMETLLFISPASVISLAIPFWIFEKDAFVDSAILDDTGLFFRTMGVVSVGGIAAFFLILAELMLVKVTSSLSMSVAGILKEILTIIGSMMIFGDKMTLLKLLGLVISSAGVLFYNYDRYMNVKEDEGYAVIQPGSGQVPMGVVGHSDLDISDVSDEFDEWGLNKRDGL